MKNEKNGAKSPKRNKKNNKSTKKNKLSVGKVIGRIFIVLGSTLLVALIFVLLVVFVLIKGPSPQAAKSFTLSAYETSAIKWVPRIFLSASEYDAIIHPQKQSNNYKELPTAPQSLIENSNDSSIASISVNENIEPIEIIDVVGSTFKGKLMIIHDPTKVQFVTLDSFGGSGLTLSQFIEKYDGIGGTNAGGFEDEGGKGKGGIPDGIVIKDGKIVYGSANSIHRGLAGFDKDGNLIVGDMSGQQALDMGMINGTNFANGPVLIKDGVRQPDLTSGVNPRTCIGQTYDGSVLLLVAEGRLAESLGANYDDLCDVLEEYGAINAVNMDGGSSSGMYYQGERITKSCSLIGDRPIPTAIVVLK